MTPTEVAAKLRAFNEWRRGGDIEYPGPLAVDEAIDAAVEMTDRLEAAEKSDAESLAMYRKARDERDTLRAEIERLQSNLSASAQAFVQLEAVAAEARRNDATAMSWISEAKHAIGYEGDMPGFIGALRELNDVRRRVPAKITVSQAPHSQYAKGWNDCMKAIKEETK